MRQQLYGIIDGMPVTCEYEREHHFKARNEIIDGTVSILSKVRRQSSYYLQPD